MLQSSNDQESLVLTQDFNDLVIFCKGISKIYNQGKSNEVVALRDIDLNIKKGEFISVMGPSGSGKTTLLNVIGALNKPTYGQIIINGQDISKKRENKLYSIRSTQIGFIFQRYYLIQTLNVLENVLSPIIVKKVDWKKKKQKAIQLLKLVGLDHRIHHKPSELSGGERQRVAIARSLISDPSIILADEPTGNLDSKRGDDIIKLLRSINLEKKITIILVTHNPKICKHTNRTIFLKDGSITTELG